MTEAVEQGTGRGFSSLGLRSASHLSPGRGSSLVSRSLSELQMRAQDEGEQDGPVSSVSGRVPSSHHSRPHSSLRHSWLLHLTSLASERMEEAGQRGLL